MTRAPYKPKQHDPIPLIPTHPNTQTDKHLLAFLATTATIASTTIHWALVPLMLAATGWAAWWLDR